MTITHIRYDELSFTSADQCLAEIKSRLERGWSLSGISTLGGQARAVFAWTEGPSLQAASPPAPARGGPQ